MGLDMNITDLVNYFTIAGALATIVATIIALLAFINWRRQQEYSLQLGLLLDLEDKFIIYIMQNIADFNAFWLASKCIRDNQDAEKYAVNDAINKHFSETLDKEKSSKAHFEMSLSLIRAERMIPIVKNKCPSIVEDVENLQKKYINISNEESSLKYYLEDIFKKRTDFLNILACERDAMKKSLFKRVSCFWQDKFNC